MVTAQAILVTISFVTVIDCWNGPPLMEYGLEALDARRTDMRDSEVRIRHALTTARRQYRWR
jgi:hypothetical protein